MAKAENYKNDRKEVARFMRRLYRQGLTTTSGGNLSLKVSDKIILITPSSTDKGRMKWNEIGIMTIEGRNLTPELKPSMEYEMHLSIYRKRSDIKSVVHAHPVFASAFTAMKCRINTDLTAEATAVCGDPHFVPYELMGTRELAAIVSDSVEESDILLLENHGILTVGSSLLQAFDRLEVLENAARMTMIVEITGKKKPLSKERIIELGKLFK